MMHRIQNPEIFVIYGFRWFLVPCGTWHGVLIRRRLMSVGAVGALGINSEERKKERKRKREFGFGLIFWGVLGF